MEDLEGLDRDEMMQRIRPLIEQGIISKDLAENVLELFTNTLKDIKKSGKKRFNPDLVVERNGKYYIVEMQVWPVWLKQRYHSTDLSWNVLLNEGVVIIPRVLASKVKVGGRVYPVAGFYYIAYSKGSDHENIEMFLKRLTRREFKLMYIDEIIKSCKDYD